MKHSEEIITNTVEQTNRASLQFSLRSLLLALCVLSVVFAVMAAYPRQTLFTLGMLAILISLLSIAAAMRIALCRCGLIKVAWEADQDNSASRATFGRFLSLLRFFGLVQPKQPVSLWSSLVIAIVNTTTAVVLWPVVRETGLVCAMTRYRPMDQVWQFAKASFVGFSNLKFWQRLCGWELWAIGRWWLLFGAVTFLWWCVSIALSQWINRQRTSETLSRLFFFAPWIVVLEVAFLFGVWTQQLNVVPEPSTGFVVGIFSWNLWHWDCWLDHEWLIRGALPTFLVGIAFFRQVLHWHWFAAIIGAALLIPVALTLSIATTVSWISIYASGPPPRPIAG